VKPPKKAKHKISTAAALEIELAGAASGEIIPAAPSRTLAHWASRYFVSEVLGQQSEHTEMAKKRDLQAFLWWFFDANGHLVAANWLRRDTRGFVRALERAGKAPTTINRVLATLRHFAKWVHAQPDSPFVDGLPTLKVKDLDTDEPSAKKLSTREINQLFKAADLAVITDKRKNSRPRRNRAILALLYYSGLRVSELCALRLDQYDGTNLLNITRKGQARTRRLYLSTDCRRYLDDYLQTERAADCAENASEWLLVVPGSDKPITRVTVWRKLNRLAESATAHSKADMHLHPHRLRHTFGHAVRKRTGSDTETAALLGHTGLAYVGRYTRNTDEERKAVLEDL